MGIFGPEFEQGESRIREEYPTIEEQLAAHREALLGLYAGMRDVARHLDGRIASFEARTPANRGVRY